jgi:AraC-like DNA-binding protein
MNLYFKFDSGLAFKKIIQDQLGELQMTFNHTGMNEVEVDDSITSEDLNKLGKVLSEFGVVIIETQKSILVQKIKDAIIEMVNRDEKLLTTNSAYLSDKLKQRYGYLTSVFSEVTYTSIENYILLQKVERAKQLIRTNEYTFTEIAYMLNYSSVAHFSNQFKSMTGITPSLFQRIIKKKRENTSNSIS